MSAIGDSLKGIISGDFLAGSTLLQNCRLEGAGARVYGRESILELFRARRLSSEFVEVIESEHSAALFAQESQGPVAVVADHYGGHLARLWYLAPASLVSAGLERIDVPFDPGFGQLTPATAFEPADHPDLLPLHADGITAMISRLVVPGAPPEAIPSRLTDRLTRVRAHVLRAFSQRDSAAALIVIMAYRGDGSAGVVQFNSAVRVHFDTPEEADMVVDVGGYEREMQRTWRPAF